MRFLMLNRLVWCVKGTFGENMSPSSALAIALMLLGLIIPVTIFTAYLHMGTFPSASPAGIHRGISHRHLTEEKSNSPKQPISKWQRHIKKQCTKHQQNTTLDAIKPEMFKHFLVDDKYKVIYCYIPKVATTTWRRIFIIMTGKSGTDDLMALRPNDVHHKHDELLTYLSDLKEDQIRERLQNYFKFVFVREPFERVLSAFRNKFDTVYQPMSVFHTLYSRRIMKRYRPKAKQTAAEIQTGKITFAEFVEFLVDPKPPVHSNEHWDQFHKLCHPCLVDYDYIGKLESIQKDSEYIMKKSGIARITKFPGRREANYKTEKTNNIMKDAYSTVPVKNLQGLLNAYRQDFDIFNYSLPVDIKTLLS